MVLASRYTTKAWVAAELVDAVADPEVALRHLLQVRIKVDVHESHLAADHQQYHPLALQYLQNKNIRHHASTDPECILRVLD